MVRPTLPRFAREDLDRVGISTWDDLLLSSRGGAGGGADALSQIFVEAFVRRAAVCLQQEYD
jgi:hypothetical protein